MQRHQITIYPLGLFHCKFKKTTTKVPCGFHCKQFVFTCTMAYHVCRMHLLVDWEGLSGSTFRRFVVLCLSWHPNGRMKLVAGLRICIKCVIEAETGSRILTVSKCLKKTKTKHISCQVDLIQTHFFGHCHFIVFTIHGEDQNENCLIFRKAQPNRGSSHPNGFYI